MKRFLLVALPTLVLHACGGPTSTTPELIEPQAPGVTVSEVDENPIEPQAPKNGVSENLELPPALNVLADFDASSSGVRMGAGPNQTIGFDGSQVTILQIVERGTSFDVHFRVRAPDGRAHNYTWNAKQEPQPPMISPDEKLLVEVSGVDKERAELRLVSTASVKAPGVFLTAKDGQSIEYAGVKIVLEQTRVRRTMDGGHATTCTLSLTESGSTKQEHMSTSFDSDGRFYYIASPAKSLWLAVVNGDNGRADLHLVKASDSGE